jgi:hypothetical protein
LDLSSAVGYLAEVIVAILLLAAPAVAAVLLWGSWGWVAAAVVVAAVEYATLQRSQRFSARFWRSVGVTRRSRQERGIEILYLLSAAAGVALLIGSLLGIAGSAHHDRRSGCPAGPDACRVGVSDLRSP